ISAFLQLFIKILRVLHLDSPASFSFPQYLFFHCTASEVPCLSGTAQTIPPESSPGPRASPPRCPEARKLPPLSYLFPSSALSLSDFFDARQNSSVGHADIQYASSLHLLRARKSSALSIPDIRIPLAQLIQG